MHKAQNLFGSETTGDTEQRVGRQMVTMSSAYIVSSCGFSTVKAIPRPANQLLLPLTHTTLGLDEGFSGWDTLQEFFTQNKGPLSGSRLPELEGRAQSHSWHERGGSKGKQTRASAEAARRAERGWAEQEEH